MPKIEIWKDVKDYEGLYQVSNLGRVKSLNRKSKTKGDKYYLRKGRILIPRKSEYLYVIFVKENTRKTCKIHRLVAETFIPNINSYPCVNHKDENKYNNNVDNLEWCSWEYNNNYGKRNKKVSIKNSKRVCQYTLNGHLIKEYYGMVEAERETGIAHQSIAHCCKGKYHTAGGYIWKYKEE